MIFCPNRPEQTAMSTNDPQPTASGAISRQSTVYYVSVAIASHKYPTPPAVSLDLATQLSLVGLGGSAAPPEMGQQATGAVPPFTQLWSGNPITGL